MAGPLPLNALNAFEVAARHRSFSKAAEELHVTPAAISQQIRTLEELLGVRLFHRLSRGLSLTDAGKSGLEKLQDGFRNVNEAVQQIRGEHDSRGLEVWMAPSFAAKWLMPRMHRFVQRHPDIDLRISASPELIDNDSTSPTLSEDIFKTHDIDIAIRFGSGNYPGCHVEKLMPVTALPLCSPTLLGDKSRPLHEPADLALHTLLHDETPYEGRPDWTSWLQAVGVSQVDGRRGLHFNRVSLALAAAVESQGVVLTLEQLAEDDIDKGRLITPFEHRVTMKQAYHFVTLQEANADDRVLAFKNWLFDEVAGNSAPPAIPQ